MHRLVGSDKASTYISILRNLTDYGRRVYLEEEDDSSDDNDDDGSDYDDEEFHTALALLDEDGNATGEVIVTSGVDMEELEDDGEDDVDFSDDDDDE